MRKFLAKLMTSWWFLIMEAFATPILITLLVVQLSKFISVLPLLVTLTALGFYANRFGFDTGDTYFVLGFAFLFSLAFLTLSPTFAAFIVGLPVGLVISEAVGDWMDKPNQDVLLGQDSAKR